MRSPAGEIGKKVDGRKAGSQVEAGGRRQSMINDSPGPVSAMHRHAIAARSKA